MNKYATDSSDMFKRACLACERSMMMMMMLLLTLNTNYAHDKERFAGIRSRAYIQHMHTSHRCVFNESHGYEIPMNILNPTNAT